MTRVRPIIVAISVSCVTLFASRANAANCATYLRDTMRADRPADAAAAAARAGRRRPPERARHPSLHVSARRGVKEAAAIVAAPDRLKDEEGLVSCASKRRPIRKICAEAAALLTAILDKYVAEPKPDYDKAALRRGDGRMRNAAGSEAAEDASFAETSKAAYIGGMNRLFPRRAEVGLRPRLARPARRARHRARAVDDAAARRFRTARARARRTRRRGGRRRRSSSIRPCGG